MLLHGILTHLVTECVEKAVCSAKARSGLSVGKNVGGEDLLATA